MLRMEPAAGLEVTVLDPAGVPLEGARVRMSPNVHWKTGYAELFVEAQDPQEMVRRRWRAGTSGSGVAVLANLPPKDREGVIVTYSGLRMPMVTTPWGVETRGAWIDLKSGEGAVLTVRLEEGED